MNVNPIFHWKPNVAPGATDLTWPLSEASLERRGMRSSCTPARSTGSPRSLPQSDEVSSAWLSSMRRRKRPLPLERGDATAIGERLA